MNIIGNAGTDEDRKEAIMGALTLYLPGAEANEPVVGQVGGGSGVEKK
jgi:hypothetical protein